MSDEEIRRLERAFAADPSDAVGLERLAAARTRVGRGWADEPLVPDLRCSARERGIYVWTRHGLGLEMVRVPGSPAFWVGRYPVTLGEWAVRVWATRANEGGGISVGRCAVSDESLLRHPVVNVTHEETLDFCAWAGLRLPTADEWERAAFGDGRLPCPAGPVCVGGDRSLDCLTCRGEGSVPRPYPWGNEPPTPERCVAASWVGRRTISGRLLASSGHEIQRTTLPVRDAEDRPARPLGASPCGAMDMVGHVSQFTDDGFARGGSFRSVNVDGGRITGPRNDDDVGFRVALGDAFGDPLRRPAPPPVTELLDPVVFVEQRGRSTPSVWRRPKRGRTRP